MKCKNCGHEIREAKKLWWHNSLFKRGLRILCWEGNGDCGCTTPEPSDKKEIP